jgi:hypothetical protein
MMNNAVASGNMIINDNASRPDNITANITTAPDDSNGVITRWAQSWAECVRRDASCLLRKPSLPFNESSIRVEY